MFTLRNKLNGSLHGPGTRGEECSSTCLTGTLEDDPVPVQGLHPDGWPDQGLVGIHHVPPPGPWWEGRGELQTVCERALRLSPLLVQFCICQIKVVSINIIGRNSNLTLTELCLYFYNTCGRMQEIA